MIVWELPGSFVLQGGGLGFTESERNELLAKFKAALAPFPAKFEFVSAR